MKKILIILGLMTSFIYADLSLAEIQKMVTKIHEKRAGVNLETLEETKEPFVRLEEDENNVSTFVIPEKDKEIEAEDVRLILHAIVNGKAYLNDEWVKIGNSILGYTLKHIGKRGVVLRNGNRIKKLFLKKQQESFILLKEK